ncbi:MAG: hypothetical protein AAFN07_05840 [Pseudomonadota bacterium]
MNAATNQSKHNPASQTHFRLLAGVCFIAMFPVALAARASNWRWQPWPPGRQGYRSAYREAKNAAKTAAAIALSA